MAVDIFNTDGIADPTGIVKHGSICVNAGVIPSRILKNNDATFNKPVINDIQEKYNDRFDDRLYYDASKPLYFDGTQILLSGLGTVNPNSPIGYAVRFKPDAVSTGLEQMILCNTRNSGSQSHHGILMDNATDKLIAQSHFGGTEEAVSSIAMVAGRWYIGCGTWSAATNRRISLDGETYVVDTVSKDVSAGSTRLAVGADYNSGSELDFFSGFIDWIVAWNAVLTQDSVNAIGDGKHPLNYQIANIVAYQNFRKGINAPGFIGPTLTEV